MAYTITRGYHLINKTTLYAFKTSLGLLQNTNLGSSDSDSGYKRQPTFSCSTTPTEIVLMLFASLVRDFEIQG